MPVPPSRAKRALADIVEFGSIRRPWTGLHVSTETSAAGDRAPELWSRVRLSQVQRPRPRASKETLTRTHLTSPSTH